MRQRRARFGRQARSAALWALAIFAAGQLGLGLLLDYRYPLVRFPSGARVLDVAAAEPRPPVYVLFGSSRMGAAVEMDRVNTILRTESGRDPAPRAITQAVPCGDAVTAEFQIEQLLRIDRKPRWAIIEVSPETLNRRNVWMSAHVIRQLNWEDVPTHWRTARRGHAGGHYAESRLVPIYTHRRQLVYEVRAAVRSWLPVPAPAPVKADGSLDWGAVIPRTDRPSDDELLKQSQAGVDTTIRKWLNPFRIEGVSPDALQRVLARCRDEGIRVVLLGIPLCTAHREAIAGPIDAEYLGFLHRMEREYGCEFIDARDWVPDREFLDPLHIRFEDGAKRFTERLTREVLLRRPAE